MATNTDGSVVIGVDLSLTQAEKQLKKLEGDIDKTGEKINDLTNRRDQAQQDGIFQSGVLDEEKVKLEEIKSRLKEARAIASDKSVDAGTRQAFKEMVPNISTELSEQQQRVRMLQAEYNQTENAVKKYGDQIINANMELDKQKAAAGQLAASIDKANSLAQRFKRHMEETGENVDKLSNRLKRLATRVMIFSVFTMGIRELRKWMMSAIKTNDEAKQSIAQLKGALLTMVQPLVNVVIPAFIMLVKVLTTVVTTIAKVVSSIFGSTVEQSAQAAENLNEEQKALKGVGSEAKKAGKSLASFDEINQLTDSSKKAGGAKGQDEIAPDFTFLDSMSDRLKEKLEEIAKIVTFIGAGFALWKIGEMLPGILGTIAANLGLIMMAVGGLVLAWDGLTDAWENGVDWINLAEMIGGVALAAFALYKVFGTLGTGIVLVVGGLAMLVTGFKDAFENGWTLQNALLAIAGIVATGLGISFLTGSVIPALIGAIGGILLAITVVTEHGGELLEGLQTIFEGVTGFFKNAIEGDWTSAFASLASAFEGVGIVFSAVLSGVRDLFVNFLTWLDEKTGGKFHDIIETFIITVEWIHTSVREVLDGIIDFIAGVFTLDWERVWSGVVKKFDGIIGLLASPFVLVINLIIDALNALIKGLNKINIDVPDWVPKLGGKKFGFNVSQIQKLQIPKLAQGAVIPPNREFMAVLGDQTSGNNIETPEGLLRQIVREESGGNYTGLLQQILSAIKEGKILMVDNDIFAQVVREADQREGNWQGVPLVTVR